MKKTYIQPILRDIILEAEEMIASSIVDRQDGIKSEVSNDQVGSVWEDSSESIWGN